MIHADQRRGLRKPISLDNGIAQTSPEFLSLAVERGATGNKCPELPSELAANCAKSPPSSQKMLILGRCEAATKSLRSPAIFNIPLDLLLQRLQHPRHANQDRYAFAPNRAH